MSDSKNTANNQSSNSSTQHHPQHPYWERPTNEVGLIDLALILVRRKLVLIISFLVFLLLTSTYVAMYSPSYLYSSVIEVGRFLRPDLERYMYLEDLISVKAKIRQRFITQALLDDINKSGEDNGYFVDVDQARDSSVIVLNSYGSADDEAYLTIHQQVADNLVADHQSIVNATINTIKAQKRRVELELEQFNKAVELAEKRSEISVDLADVNINDILSSIRVSALEINKSNEDNKDPDQVIKTGGELAKTLQTAKELDLLREKLDTLATNPEVTQSKQQLSANIAKAIDLELTKFNQNYQYQIEKRQERITEFDAQIASIRPTRVVIKPYMAATQGGLSKTTIFSIGLILSVIFAITLTFFVEFMAKVSAKNRETQ